MKNARSAVRFLRESSVNCLCQAFDSGPNLRLRRVREVQAHAVAAVAEWIERASWHEGDGFLHRREQQLFSIDARIDGRPKEHATRGYVIHHMLGHELAQGARHCIAS